MALQEADLRVGDVLLKRRFGGAVHFVIARMTDSRLVHAAMYIGNGTIAESIGSGFEFTQLMSQGHNYEYEVWRNQDRDLAEIAALCANTLVQTHVAPVQGYASNRWRFGAYGMGQAISGAIANRWTRPGGAGAEGARAWEGGIRSSYCSQFVVQAYNAAGATSGRVPLNIAAGRATPVMLRNTMLATPGWAYQGLIVAR